MQLNSSFLKNYIGNFIKNITYSTSKNDSFFVVLHNTHYVVFGHLRTYKRIWEEGT